MRDLLEPIIKIIKPRFVTLDEVLGDSRSRHIVRARDEVIAMLLSIDSMSLNGVANLLQRDHSGIIAARDRHRKRNEAA